MQKATTREESADGRGDPARGAASGTKARWATFGTVLGFAIAAGLGIAREQGWGRGSFGTLGRAGDSLSEGLQSASTTVRDGFARTRTSVRNLGLEQQIEARLHGDKMLDADRIEVRVEDESTAILKGLVPDDAAKEKAVILTRDTRGVLRVVDHLAVPPTPRVIAATGSEARDETPVVAVRPRPGR